MSSVVWTAAASGDWGTAADWTDSSNGTHHVPGPTDDAVINTAVTVTHSANSDTVQSLTIGAAGVASNFTLSGSTLTVTGTVSNHGTGALTLGINSTLASATIAAGTTLVLAQFSNANLSGVTVNSNLTVPSFTTLNITNNLALNDATLTDNGTVQFTSATDGVTTAGTATITGGGTVTAFAANSAITFGSGVTLSGSLNVGFNAAAGVTWTFMGTVSADLGQTLTLSAASNVFINEGDWMSTSGGTLTLGGIWTNKGTITVANFMGVTSTLNLSGNFITAGIGTLNHSSGNVNLDGSLDNTGTGDGDTLILDNNRGTWNLTSFGIIHGGTITTEGNAVLNLAAQNFATLDGVTLAGNMTLGGYSTLNITNGLTLDGGTMTDVNATNASLNFSGGSQSVDGTGTIIGDRTIQADTTASTITFASGVTLSGGFNVGANSAAGVTWDFQGTVSAGIAQSMNLAYNGNVYVNEGNWQSISGGTLNLGGNWTNQNGTITVANTATDVTSTVNLGGTFTTAGIGTVNYTSGAVNITGTLDNTGATLALDNTTGTWNLAGGTIISGTITTAGSAVLNIPRNSDSTLRGVTLAGNATLAGFDRLNIVKGLTLAGGAITEVDPTNASLNFRGGSQTVDGTGTITGGSIMQTDTTGSTITFASGVTLSGGFNVGINSAGGITWDFRGIVSAGFGQTMNLANNGNAYINEGDWQSISGGTFNLDKAWTNAAGTITVANFLSANSTVNLGGSFTTADIGTVNYTSGTVNVTGTLDNTGATLALADTTGTWNLSGTIISGTITTAGSAVLNIARNSNATLSGVALAGNVTSAGFNTLNIVNGLTLNGGTITDNASLNFKNGSQAVNGTGTITGTGRIQADTAGTITFASGVIVNGGWSIGGGNGSHTWIFQGTVSANTSGQTLSFTSRDTFTNQGTFEARDGGTLSLPTGPTYRNYSGTTLTGGVWQVVGSSKMILVGSGIATDAANIILDGSGAAIYRDGNGTVNALAGLTSVTSGNSLDLRNGARLTTTGTLTNAGAVSIDATSVLTVGASYIQTQGATRLDGTLTARTLVDVQNGTLAGTGTVSGNLQNEGSILIGTDTTAGTLTVTGTFAQSASGNLTIKVGGANPGVDFDQLVVGGAATLNGSLTVQLINGFVPDSGTTYQVLTFASETGTFATLAGDGSLFTPAYDATDVTLTAN